jgi:oligopeptidase B
MTPPRAAQRPHARTIHGETVADPWFWLRDRNDPETIEHLEAENRFTEAFMEPARELEKKLYCEMVSRIQETDVSVPYREGNWEYFTRTEQSKQYQIHCRRPSGAPGGEQVLIDCNQLAAGHDYFSLAFWRVSPDGHVLAYAIDTDGSEVYTLHFRNLLLEIDLPETISGVYYDSAWASDNLTFFYTTLDESKRPHRLWRHALSAFEPDELVFEEPDARFNVGVHRTRSGRYLLLNVNSHTTTEFHYLNAEDPPGEFRLLQPRRQGVEYFIEHQGEHFWMRTNEEAVNFRLLRAPIGDLGFWTEVIPHSENTMIEDIDGFCDHVVVTERFEGLRRLRIIETDDMTEHFVPFEEAAYTVHTERNEEYNTRTLRFLYTSLVMPRSIYDYNMSTGERELKKQFAVLGGYDAGKYASERVFATAPDGQRVPISLVYRRGINGDGSSPLYLYGYGSYGIITEPSFSSDRISLLDRGFVFAIAHIRGSADMGRRWYETGKLLHKRNTFTDFIAAADHLVAEGYTSPQKLVIGGGSAGGLLMGAVANLRPELFRVVVAHVPFVDVVNTMLDDTLPLTITEYEEWGNPHIEKFYRYMRSYAPYENVTRQAYPHVLATGGLNDPRVPYWEPAKWVQKLRACTAGNGVILLKTIMGAGHSGPSGRYSRLEEKAFEYAFVLSALETV